MPGLHEVIVNHIQIHPECLWYMVTCNQLCGKVSPMSALESFDVIHFDCCSSWAVNYELIATCENIKHQILIIMMVDAGTAWPKFGPLLNCCRSCHHVSQKILVVLLSMGITSKTFLIATVSLGIQQWLKPCK